MPKLGAYISLEGIDGADLATQTELLSSWLKKQGRKVVLTKEPTSSPIGGLIRAALKGEWETDKETLALLFAADRANHLHRTVLPAVSNGSVVVADRSMLSQLAYESDELRLTWLRALNSEFPKPDVTVIIDVPADVAMKRLASGRTTEQYAMQSQLHAVRRRFLKLQKEFPNCFVVDGNQTPEKVNEEVARIVKRFL